jgi:hypothetical protein
MAMARDATFLQHNRQISTAGRDRIEAQFALRLPAAPPRKLDP